MGKVGQVEDLSRLVHRDAGVPLRVRTRELKISPWIVSKGELLQGVSYLRI